MTDFNEVLAKYPWKPIPGCPGRYILAMDVADGPPSRLVQVPCRGPYNSNGARDRVLVTEFPGGGLISYLKPDGRCLHTLNDRAGFERKLLSLGLAPQQSACAAPKRPGAG